MPRTARTPPMENAMHPYLPHARVALVLALPALAASSAGGEPPVDAQSTQATEHDGAHAAEDAQDGHANHGHDADADADAGLPAARWADGSAVEPEITRWWVVLACKLKEPGGNALLTRYMGLLDSASRQALGSTVLRQFIAQDTRHPPLEEGIALTDASITLDTGAAAFNSSKDLVQGQTLPSSRFANRNDDFRPDADTLRQLASFGEDSAGNLYIVSVSGNIFMVRPVS